MYGHGFYKHSNGYEYEGLFENNQPAKTATNLMILTSEELNSNSTKQQKFEIYEAQNFKVWVRTLNDQGEVFIGIARNYYFLNT